MIRFAQEKPPLQILNRILFSGPLLADETLSFTSFRDVAQPLKAVSSSTAKTLAGRLLTEVFHLLIKEKVSRDIVYFIDPL